MEENKQTVSEQKPDNELEAKADQLKADAIKLSLIHI